ncbi:SAM-dependent DNA methyltransferase [bacterium AH-315-J21]|nr:SAM-dependent DNA methyltransferase [bacterium AH-315-J21]
MKQIVRTMLEDMLSVFTDKFPEGFLSWDRFIEFIATEARGSLFYKVDHKFEWLHTDRKFSERVLRLYDSELLASDYYDHLGDLYMEYCHKNLRSDFNTPRIAPYSVVEGIAKTFIKETDAVKSVFVPYASTGRLMMVAQQIAPNALLFGSESDLRLYRIAYTNLCIHNIHAALINADHEVYELDISTEAGRKNWKYANSWYDQRKNLLPKPAPLHVH